MTEQSAMTVRPEAPELTPFEVIERVITSGDLARMDPAARVAFYWRTCESLGLNPLTRPFQYLNLSGRVVLYATKDATDQLRRIHGVSVTGLRRERDDDLGLYTVLAHVRTPDGREDEASGVVNVRGLSGDALATALMKAETKAKRRATLSMVGLGVLDESEVEGIGERLEVDHDTGEIKRAEPPSLIEAVRRQAATLAGEPEPAPEAAAELAPEAAPDLAPRIATAEAPSEVSPPERSPEPEAPVHVPTAAEAAGLAPVWEEDEEPPAPPEAEPETVEAIPVCGSANPYAESGPTCSLEPGHRGYHRAGRTSWPA